MNLTAAALLLFIALLHLYWVLGGTLLKSKAIPEKRDGAPLFRPGKAGTFAVACVLIFAAYLLTPLNSLQPKLSYGGTVFFAVVFLIRGIGDFRYVGMFKKVRGTNFARADSAIYTPLMFILSAVFAFNL